MANFSTLIAEIEAYIKTNGEQEITGQILQNVLKDIVDTLGNGAVFKGIATTDGTPGTPDNNVFYFAALAGTYTNYGGTVLDGNTLHILAYNGSWTDVDTGVPSATAAATFAKIDGYYASLTAGAAENLVGRGSVPASFLRRTTGGTADVGTGSAKIAKLMGNSIVWNQAVPQAVVIGEHNGQWGTFDSGTALTANGNELQILKSSGTGIAYCWLSGVLISGHKYYMAVDIKTTAEAGKITVSAYAVDTVVDAGRAQITSSNWQRLARIATCGTASTQQFRITDTRSSDFDTVYARNFALVDLTKMFGAGKEPTTVAEFEALYPLEFYKYNAGEVLPFAAEKLVTTGFNQWDEQWEKGTIDQVTGNNASSNDEIRSKNYIPVFAGQTYYMKGIPRGSYNYLFYYDANKNYLGYSHTASSGLGGGNPFTIPEGAAYMRFRTRNYGPVYNNDICINLSWSGYRNGEYEPYELHEAIFDPVNWEDANGNKIFPYGGMHGVGTTRDFATPDTDGFIRKGTRVFGRVDLGSLSYESYASAEGKFVARINDKKMDTSCQIFCSSYDAVSGNRTEITTPKAISNFNDGTYNLYIVNPDFAGYTVAQVAAAMSGVYLYYELATPVETELATPVAASYYANDFGTEEWQPANGAEPYTAPCEMQVAYAMNAVDTLRRLPENYISVASFENFCTELATKLGAALNKSITIAATYDAEDEEYDYAITIEDIEEG